MIRVVMFDLGMTLIDQHNQPFAHAAEALAAISQLRNAAGKPLFLCLVSDFTMPTPPPTPAKINVIFKEYLALLSATGLRSFFEPVKRRVTLSTHAGVPKPDRRIFETAIKRLAVQASLPDCLFVTESLDHVRVARNTLGMRTLQFKPTGEEAGFHDWSQAPALIAHIVGIPGN